MPNWGTYIKSEFNIAGVVFCAVQPFSSSFNGVEFSTLESTIYNALCKETPLELYGIKLDLVPADIYLADAEQELLFADQREQRLKEVLVDCQR